MTSTTRTAHHAHPPTSLNAPQGLGSIFSQKSHVVAGVQDAYWSDDEEEGTECPLCVSEMDMDDLNFKPCPCGYQLCRFCYHHIKENLNGRCPACRREYSDDVVEWKAMSPDDQKRLHQQKKQKEKEKKELEALKRGHLPNMRVVQRNVVYVTGLGPKYAKEELIPSLRSHEYFGQYGKISKIVLVKRNSTANREATTGLYISYHRREDAARAIAGVDGSPSPGGGGQVMRASYGTTKYCISFLRNVTCTNQGCRELHEWGDDKDSFNKEDLTTLKHAMKDSENRQKFVVTKEADSLPRSASWGKVTSSPKPANAVPVAFPTQTRNGRPARTSQPQPRSQTPRGPTQSSEPPARTVRPPQERESDRERDKVQDRRGHTHTSSSGSSGPAAAAASKTASIPNRASARSPGTSRSSTPAASSLPSRPSTAADIQHNGADPTPAKSPPPALTRLNHPTSPIPKQAVVIPTVIPKPTPPPPPSAQQQQQQPPSSQSAQSGYQPSSQAQALLDDVRARRESTTKTFASPFPDLDRTLTALNSSDYSFSFNIDPKLASKASAASLKGKGRQSPAFKGSFDPFASSTAQPHMSQPSQAPQSVVPPPPGLSVRPTVQTQVSPSISASQPINTPSRYGPPSSYSGSFDPFSEGPAASPSGTPSSQQTPLFDDDSRRASRFGFAQRRGGAGGMADGMSSRFGASAASSPLAASENLPQTPLYASSDVLSPMPSSSTSQHLPQWTLPVHHEYGPPPGMSPLLYNNGQAMRGHHHPQQQPMPMNSMDGFATLNNGGDMSLKEMLNIGRQHPNSRIGPPMQHYQSAHQQSQQQQNHPFNDPAIMSMRMGDGIASDPRYPTGLSNGNMSMRPPPGLAQMAPPGLQRATPPQRAPQSLLVASPVQDHLPLLTTTTASRQPSLAALASDPPRFAQPLGTVRLDSSSAPTPPSPTISPAEFPALPTAPAPSHNRAQPFISTKVSDPRSRLNEKSALSPPTVSQAGLPPKEKHGKSGQRQKTGSQSHTSSEVAPSLPPTPAVAVEALDSGIAFSSTANEALKLKDVPIPKQPPMSRKEKRVLAKKQQVKPPSTTTSSAVASPRPPTPPALSQTDVTLDGKGDGRITEERTSKGGPETSLSLHADSLVPSAAPPLTGSVAAGPYEVPEPVPATPSPQAPSSSVVPAAMPVSNSRHRDDTPSKTAVEGSTELSEARDHQHPVIVKHSLSMVVPAAPPTAVTDEPEAAVIPSSGDLVHPETSVPVMSKRERKILAAKAAQEAASERLRDAAKAKAAAEEDAKAAVPIVPSELQSIEDMLLQIREYANVDLMAFFDPKSINPKPHPPLPYSPLVRALSALSLGNGAFVDNTPSSNIDSAVSSFQTLLETLTQTISDLLRLLPRTTWTDSSSFDGVLHEMLKADDFVKDTTEDALEQDDEVAALTLALERRAKWMEVQLAKLEELHRDINNAAVRAVLTINDRGWDAPRFLPRDGGSVARFEKLGKLSDGGSWRAMTLGELESELDSAKAAESTAEVDLKRAMRVNLEYV